MSIDSPEGVEVLGLERVEIKKAERRPLRDFSSLWKLPFPPNKLVFFSQPEEGKPRAIGWRSGTEGRSLTLDPVVFRFDGGLIEEINKHLLWPIPLELIKGGKRARPMVATEYYQKGGGIHPDLARRKNTRARYLPRSEIGRTDSGPPAGASDNKDIGLDEAFSFLFHCWGGRTRLPIATWQVNELLTREGPVSLQEAVRKGILQEGIEPVISSWGMRTRWRLDDIIAIFRNKRQKSTSRTAVLFPSAHPEVKLFKYEKKVKPEVGEKAMAFAKEIIIRANFDDDSRWQQLAAKYKDLEEGQISDFYVEYLGVLSESLGEQMGFLYKNRVYLYMLNFQNFTALGEMVDFDVAVFEARRFINGEELSREEMKKHDMLTPEEIEAGQGPSEPLLQASMVFQTIGQLTELYAAFRIPGIINLPKKEFQEAYDQAMRQFGQGFVKTSSSASFSPKKLQRNSHFYYSLGLILGSSRLWSDFKPILPALGSLRKLVFGRVYEKGREKAWDYSLHD